MSELSGIILREQGVKCSDEVNELFAALGQAQAAISAIEKDQRVSFYSKKMQRDITYEFASAAALKRAYAAPLAKASLCLTFVTSGGKMIGILGHKSGQWIAGELPAPTGDDFKSTGSAMTYVQRYITRSLLGLVTTEDDDALDADGEIGEVTTKAAGNSAAAPAQKTYGSPESFLARVNEKTGGYYENIHHIKNTIGGEWPAWSDRDAVATAGRMAIDHASAGDDTRTPAGDGNESYYTQDVEE